MGSRRAARLACAAVALLDMLAGVEDTCHAHNQELLSLLHEQAARVFAEELAAARVPSVRAIRVRLHVGQPRAQRVPRTCPFKRMPG